MEERASPGAKRFTVRKVPDRKPAENAAAPAVGDDLVAIEEPLEIRLNGAPLVVTLRTPGHDAELAAGFLFAEGILQHRDELVAIRPSSDPLAYDPDNLIEVELNEKARSRQAAIQAAHRERLSVAACGLCGKATLESIYQRLPPLVPLELDETLLPQLIQRMEAAQRLFPQTGGVHAAALFDAEGNLQQLFEDVGRHNALDKLVGQALLRGELPWHGKVVVTSARAGFELVQKTMLAGASALVAVGATSSLAIEAARRGGLALYAFTRPGRSNRYC